MLLFLDIETTGFDKKTDEILEISAVRWDGEKITHRFDRLLKLENGAEISPEISNLTGITGKICEEEGVSHEKAREEFQEFIQEDDIIIGHNIQFDTGFLQEKNFLLFSPEEIDTFIISLLVLGQFEQSHSLEVLSEKFGIHHAEAHRAMSDVLANLEVYQKLQEIYLENFSPNFQSFLNSKNFSFTEKLFFDEAEKIFQEKSPKKEFCLSVEKLPEWKSHKQVRTDFFDTIFSEKKNCFFECQEEEKYIFDILGSAQKNGEKIAIFYPPSRKKEFFSYANKWNETHGKEKNMEADIQLDLFTENSNVVENFSAYFDISHTEKVCKKKWEKFLEKESFTRAESIVAVKFFKALEENQHYFIRFMGEEWKGARDILGEENFSLPGENFCFLPFSESIFVPDDFHKIFFDTHHLEDHLYARNTEKFFQKRLQEDGGENENIQKFLEILDDFAQKIRILKGENQFSIATQLSELKRENFFGEFQKNLEEFFEKSLSETEKMKLLPWRKFFTENEKNFVKTVEIFSDNLLAIENIDPDFTDIFSRVCSEYKANIFLGDSFPKKMNGEISWSFPLHEKWEIFTENPSFPSKIFVPNILRDQTPAEMAQHIEKYWDENDIVVSVTSQKTADSLIEFLREKAKEKNISLFSRKNGGVGKIENLMRRSEKKILIGNAKFLDNFDLLSFGFSVHVVHKFLFDHPKKPFIAAQRSAFQSDFYDYSLPRAGSRFRHEVLRLGMKAGSICIFCDGRLADETLYQSKLQKLLPENSVEVIEE